MSGVTSFIGNLGGLLAQTPLVFMVAVLTWRHTFAVIGVASLLIAVLCYLIIRNTPGEMAAAGTVSTKAEKALFSSLWLRF